MQKVGTKIGLLTTMLRDPRCFDRLFQEDCHLGCPFNPSSPQGFKKIAAWGVAFKAARRALGIKGFCPCGGKSRQGQELLKKTRSLYKK